MGDEQKDVGVVVAPGWDSPANPCRNHRERSLVHRSQVP